MKKPISVVVIDDNRAVTSSIEKYFLNNDKIKIVKIFDDGRKGLDYLINNTNDYNFYIMDILLPNLDGIKILEELKIRNIHKKGIILSSFKDDYTINQVKNLSNAFYMMKPFSVESLESRILEMDLNSNMSLKEMSSTIEVEVSNILHSLGIPSHLKGYQYIREGIIIMYDNKLDTLITKEVYPEIAYKYDTTVSRVERAIRHAIEVSWIRGDLKMMEDLFGNSIDFERAKPTNGEFLTTIADRIKLNKQLLIN